MMTMAYMTATADITDSIIVQNRVRQRYFSPPCGGFFNLGMISKLYFQQSFFFSRRSSSHFIIFSTTLLDFEDQLQLVARELGQKNLLMNQFLKIFQVHWSYQLLLVFEKVFVVFYLVITDKHTLTIFICDFVVMMINHFKVLLIIKHHIFQFVIDSTHTQSVF